MRKTFITLAIVLAMASLVGCGGDSAQYTPPPVTESNQFVFLQGQPTPTPSPTGTPVAIISETQVMVGSLTSNGRFEFQPVGEPDLIWSAQFSQDGQKAAFTIINPETGDRDAVVANSAGGSLVTVGVELEADQFYPALSPDKNRVLWIEDTGDYDIMVGNADGTGTPVNITTGIKVPFFDATFSPDGNSVIASDMDSDGIWTIDIETGEATNLIEEPDENAVGFAFPAYSPDGSTIFYCQRDLHPDDPETEEDESYYSWNIYTMGADGSEPEQLTGGDMDLYPHFAGDRMMYQSAAPGNVEIYTRLTSGGPTSRLTGNNVFDGFTLEFSGEPIGFVSNAKAAARIQKWPVRGTRRDATVR